MIIRARAPLRLGLAGGGTDLAPFCDLHGGYVLNATIDMYAYAILQPRSDGVVRFVAADREEVLETAATDFIPPDGKLDLHRGVYNHIVREFNAGTPLALTLTTFCDVPPGSGLGSSSTMVVAMLKAFTELLGLPLGEYDVAHMAFEIERIDIGLSGGKQDQYAATFGGFNFMEFNAADHVIVNPLRVKNWIISELETSLILYYTGVSRSSAAIIDEQARNVKSHDEKSINALLKLKDQALTMKEYLLKGDLEKFSESLDQSWEAKKMTAQKISNPEIDIIYDLAKQAGARAGKISGAGGGGFMMLLVDPARRMDVTRVLRTQQGQVMTCHFVKHGTQGWKIS